MDLLLAKNLAKSLINNHQLGQKGWRFKFDRAKKRCGRCSYTEKTITMSLHFVTHNNYNEVKDTMLHEIAHAICGHEHGHNRNWKRVAIAIGCSGDRLAKDVQMPKGRYRWFCPICNISGSYHRRPKYLNVPNAYKCKKCGSGIQWNTYL